MTTTSSSRPSGPCVSPRWVDQGVWLVGMLTELGGCGGHASGPCASPRWVDQGVWLVGSFVEGWLCSVVGFGSMCITEVGRSGGRSIELGGCGWCACVHETTDRTDPQPNNPIPINNRTWSPAWSASRGASATASSAGGSSSPTATSASSWICTRRWGWVVCVCCVLLLCVWTGRSTVTWVGMYVRMARYPIYM